MSQQNVEIVRRIFDAWNQGDFDAAWAACDSELVIDRSRSLVDSRIYRGTEDVEQFWSDWRNTCESTRW